MSIISRSSSIRGFFLKCDTGLNYFTVKQPFGSSLVKVVFIYRVNKEHIYIFGESKGVVKNRLYRSGLM